MRSKIYLKPLVSEKTIDLTGKNCYTFLVDPRASRPGISRMIFEKFGIKPKKVNILSKPVKEIGRPRQKKGFTAKSKKALVFMPAGKKLPGFEIAESKDQKKKDESK